ncbi:hypothetical protein [Pimelobacter simplex]|uniref:hypothetical protein n=1 Tax=Nocardioides simplex TaxID=2045 RepID=UPI003AAAD6A4
MKHLSARRSATALLVTSVALAGLAAVPAPAHAAPNLDGGMYADLTFDDDAMDCTVPFADDAPMKTFTDNGVSVTQSWADTATSVSDNNPADITDLAASSSITISATPIGASGATIKATVQASASAQPRLATSACEGLAKVQAQANGSFLLDRPMWATVTAQGTGQGMVQAITGPSDALVAAVSADRGTASATGLLPAGPQVLSVITAVRGRAAGRHASSYRGSISVRLSPMGEASPVTGNGRGYATLGARSCTSNTVAAGLSAKVKKAKKVVVQVNGAKAASFQGKKLKKRTFAVRAAAGSKAQVTATITLRNGKTVSVSRSYLPCA